ncbi:serine/threonine-protein kinase, partial [bacterium]|nr:serine/threonine-protein kinase [bacterium]
LPHEWTRDPDAKARFMNEARAASALDHNNICTIHEVDETEEGQLFIAMAFYEGETVREKIERGPLKLDETIDLATQIAEGLAKAHQKDIVHRDLKPANVLVTEDGVAKIVDFGLAKLAGRSMLTKEGTTLGTAAYMSPEQARGEVVDHRTDIFSLGVLSYEMITGQQPFKGDYEQAVVYSIMNEDPEPPTGLRTGVPVELERAVFKCLQKSPAKRYQSATDLLVDLRQLSKVQDASQKSALTTTAGRTITGTKSRRGLFALGAIGLAGLVALFMYFQKSRDPKPIRLTNPRKVTQAIGREHQPTWSPDGSKIAYTSDQDGRPDIWIKQLAGGEPVNLTKEMPNGGYRPRWSPDGSQIAFRSFQDEAFHVWVIPAIGGAATKVASNTGFWPNQAWSPDGTRLVYVVKDSAGVPYAEIYTLSTREKRTVALPGTEFVRLYLSWSPQGDYFAYTDAIGINGFLRTVRLADGQSFQITTKDRSVLSPHWSPDGRLLYFSSNRGGTRDLWQVKLKTQGDVDGKPEQISSGLDMENFAFSKDHTKIAYAKGERHSNLWRITIPKPDAPAKKWTGAKQLTFETSVVDDPELSPDGKRIYFTSRRSGNADIWSMPADGGELRQVTMAPEFDARLRFSPDGRTVAFESRRSGSPEIWIMPATGGPAKQITHDRSPKFWPNWSPDGQTLAFVAQDSMSKADLWIVPAQGGEAQRVTTDPTNKFMFLWWPDGRSLVSTVRTPGRIDHQLWRFPISGESPEAIADPNLNGLMPDDLLWSTDRKQIYFIRWTDADGTKNIWSLSVADGSVRQLTDFRGHRGLMGRRFATDGIYFYFTWREETGDIWVMDVEREE